ncbi:MAG: mechanosensitive ion channel family protein [Bryobacterales bacterium]|jgi:small-conductance mechanosensitive channel|nr:mechanosensitive ion channel family protein [Bryobacterales bacterium]
MVTWSITRSLALACLWAWGLLLFAQPTTPTPTREAASQGAAVTLHGKELFRIEVPLGAFSAAERAAAISSRLRVLSESPDDSLPPLVAEDLDGITVISCGPTRLLSITDADANAAGMDRAAFAAQLVSTLGAVLAEEQRQFSWRALLQGVALALFATLVLFAFYHFTRRALRGLIRVVIRLKRKRIHDVRYQKTVLLSARRVSRILVFALRAAWVLLILLALYVYLPIVFRFFPYTRELSNRIIAYTLSPLRVLWEAFLVEIPNLFFILVIVVLTYYAVRFARFLFREVELGNIELPGFYADWAMPTFKIVRLMLIAFALVIAYPYIPGSGSEAFKGITIFFGLLFSLGSTGIVANAVSGVILTYTRAFVIGDRVKIGETTGDVVEKTLLVTRLRTVKNVDVSVPNSMLLSHQIVNYSSVAKEKGLILHTTVTIGYDVPWRTVHQLLVSAALDTRDVLENPKPFVLQTSLDDFYVSYQLNAYTFSAKRMAGIYSELHCQIQDKFNEAGVEIMSPHYRAARDGNLSTIPSQYLPGDYRPPRFQVDVQPPPPTG